MRIFKPFMSSGVFTSRTLFVRLRNPFSEKASVRIPVALRISSTMSRTACVFANSHAAIDEPKR